MGKLKLNLADTFLLIITLVVMGCYFLFNQPIGQVHVARVGLDNHIPFRPVFIVPYLLFLPVFWLIIIYTYLKNQAFRPLAITILAVYLISYLVFVLHQTFDPRPVVIGHDVFSNLTRWTYSVDRPYGAWPSLHAASATIMALYFICLRSRWWRHFRPLLS